VRFVPRIPQRLFRVADKAIYAEDFLAGRIWLTTFEHCRKREDAEDQRADREEGTASKNQWRPERYDPVQRIVEYNNIDQERVVVPDALLLCMMKEFDQNAARRMGGHTVIVNNSVALLQAIGRRLSAFDFAQDWTGGVVTYGTRERFGQFPTESPILLKPEPFRWQREARFVYMPRPNAPFPGPVEVPEARLFCCSPNSSEASDPLFGHLITNQRLEGLHLDLDLIALKDCELVNCTIYYSALGDLGLLGKLSLSGCRLVMEHRALATVRFLGLFPEEDARKLLRP
jgi:hypothetical protein